MTVERSPVSRVTRRKPEPLPVVTGEVARERKENPIPATKWYCFGWKWDLGRCLDSISLVKTGRTSIKRSRTLVPRCSSNISACYIATHLQRNGRRDGEKIARDDRRRIQDIVAGTKIFSGGQKYSTIPKNTGSVAGYRDGCTGDAKIHRRNETSRKWTTHRIEILLEYRLLSFSIRFCGTRSGGLHVENRMDLRAVGRLPRLPKQNLTPFRRRINLKFGMRRLSHERRSVRKSLTVRLDRQQTWIAFQRKNVWWACERILYFFLLFDSK